MPIANPFITDNESYKVILFGKNLLYHVYMDDSEIDLRIMKELTDGGLNLTNDKPFYSIVNLQNVFGSMTNEAKEYVATNAKLNELKIIEILLVNSLSMKLLISGYLKINKPKTKTVVVKNFEEIKAHLNEHKVSEETIGALKSYLAEIK